jgi:LDH2 family malate/lactate/ureidoglycolate dehydrogenase
MKISVDELKELTITAIRNFGYDDGDTSIISEVLLYAQLRGNNQGIAKLIGKGIPINPDAVPVSIAKETPISATLDGGQNHSMVVLANAVETAIEKAAESGFGIVGTFNTSTSSGAIGFFAERIASAGFIGHLYSSPPPRVCASGSYEPIFGTNPIAVGIPTANQPIVLDMSTAAMSFYGLVEAKTAGREIPGDVAYDGEGNLTTSPEKAIAGGALRSFDRGSKGSGLALLTEIMAGPLVGASFAGIGARNNWGHLVYAFDPGLLGEREDFLQNVTALLEKLKSSKKLPGVEELYYPGERGRTVTTEHIQSNQIEVEENLLAGLRDAADSTPSENTP